MLVMSCCSSRSDCSWSVMSFSKKLRLVSLVSVELGVGKSSSANNGELIVGRLLWAADPGDRSINSSAVSVDCW